MWYSVSILTGQKVVHTQGNGLLLWTPVWSSKQQRSSLEDGSSKNCGPPDSIGVPIQFFGFTLWIFQRSQRRHLEKGKANSLMYFDKPVIIPPPINPSSSTSSSELRGSPGASPSCHEMNAGWPYGWHHGEAANSLHHHIERQATLHSNANTCTPYGQFKVSNLPHMHVLGSGRKP